jgi:hypothetical protein
VSSLSARRAAKPRIAPCWRERLAAHLTRRRAHAVRPPRAAPYPPARRAPTERVRVTRTPVRQWFQIGLADHTPIRPTPDESPHRPAPLTVDQLHDRSESHGSTTRNPKSARGSLRGIRRGWLVMWTPPLGEARPPSALPEHRWQSARQCSGLYGASLGVRVGAAGFDRVGWLVAGWTARERCEDERDGCCPAEGGFVESGRRGHRETRIVIVS